MANNTQLETKVELLDNRVMIQPLPKTEQSSGGVILAEMNVPHPAGEGLIVERGPGKSVDGAFIDTKVNVGDKVFFNPHAGHDVVLSGKQYIIVDDSAIIATFGTKPKLLTKEE